MRKLGVLAAGMAVLMTALMLGRNTALVLAAGPTCNVPGDYPTIQAAVSAPGCTTVNVASGTYAENVTISHSLTLNGAKHGVDARGRSGSESVIDGTGNANITITADNVTVDGFTLLGPLNQGTAAVVMMGANIGELIQNNIIQNPGRAASFNTRNTTFRQNAVHSTATAGDGFQENSSPTSNVSILNNSFDGATGAYNADVTIIGGFSTDPLTTGIVISGNSSKIDSTLIALFNTNGAQITNNIVAGATGSAIYIGGRDSNVVVSGNHVSGGTFSAVKVANAFGDGPSSAITVTGNTLKGNAYGVNVAAGAITAMETVQVHQNNITGNTTDGVNNDSSGAVAATCNWWGSATGPGPVGPGTGDRVSPNVTFKPWLTAPAPSGDCAGGTVPTDEEQCKHGGYKNYTNAEGQPFKNQGQCVAFVQHQKGDHGHGSDGGD